MDDDGQDRAGSTGLTAGMRSPGAGLCTSSSLVAVRHQLRDMAELGKMANLARPPPWHFGPTLPLHNPQGRVDPTAAQSAG